MKPLKSKVSITLDSDIIDRIKELAEADDRLVFAIHQFSFEKPPGSNAQGSQPKRRFLLRSSTAASVPAYLSQPQR